MDFRLDQVEVRVLGALMEKESATPEYYPLSLNALVAASNQKTNRDPVVSLDVDAVLAAIEGLRARGLAMDISGAEHRVHKYAHRLGEVFNFDRRQQAVLCLLMLRGPQTVGELRGRTERLYSFDDLAAVDATLRRLMERTPPLVTKLAREAGEKEPRFAHLLAGEVAPPEPQLQRASLEERVARLEVEFADFKRQFEEFRRSFD